MRHPLRAVQRLGRVAARQGMYLGLIVAILLHAAAIASPEYTMWQLRHAATAMREELRNYLGVTQEIALVADEPDEALEDVVEEPPDEPEEDPETPELPLDAPPEEPADTPPADDPLPDDAKPDEDVYPDDDAPAPAEAPDTLTADSDAVDLSGDGWEMVDKDGSKSTGGGYTAVKGTSKRPVRSRHAKVGGRRGGKGKGLRRSAPAKRPDRSRRAGVLSKKWSGCPFPPQANLQQINNASAIIAVTIGPSGRATSARVISDPGYGFGAQARVCALAKRYRPALNAAGVAISSTKSIRVGFHR